jgi:eukaryotic-like serine/threonine-protein kinase
MDLSSEARDPVEALAEEFIERRRRGESPGLDEYLRRYPHLADEIRELFPALLMMEDLGESSGGSVEAWPREGDRLPEGISLRKIGDYRLLREVGRGGMGVVYEAEQESLGRRVAIKILPAGALMDPRRLRRFQREARSAAKMHHTNIVPVFGVGEHEGTHYYVMQFIQGLGLDDVLDELKRLKETKSGLASGPTESGSRRSDRYDDHDISAADVARSLATGKFAPDEPGRHSRSTQSLTPPLTADWSPSNGSDQVERHLESDRSDSSSSVGSSSDTWSANSGWTTMADSDRGYWRSVARIGLQVAQALDYANRQKIVHRDIKPSNLLLDLKGNIWVTDFGLAKAGGDAEDLTHTGDIVGTIRYMAPERFAGRCDARADIYSLGLTLYELLALRPAFEGSDRHRLIQRVTQVDPPRLRKLNRAIPRDLETIIHKAIAREPERRYSSAEAMAEDLQRLLDDKPIQARRIGPIERLARWCRRNPGVASLAAALVLSLFLGTTVSMMLAMQQTRSARAARFAESQATEQRDLAITAEREAESQAARSRRLLYAADMQLAGHVWENDDGAATKLDNLLEDQVPRPGEEDLRDVAWRLLWTQANNAEAMFHDPHGVQDVTFDSSNHVVSVGSDWKIRAWDPSQPGHPARNIFTPPFPVMEVALAPGGLEAAVLDSTSPRVQLVTLESKLVRLDIELPMIAQKIQFSSNGLWLIITTEDHRTWIHDIRTGEKHAEFQLPHAHPCKDFDVAGDGTTLVLANYPLNSDVAICKLPDETNLLATTAGSTAWKLAVSLDSDRLAWGDSAGKIGLWDLSRAEPLGPELNDTPSNLSEITFSPSGEFLAAGWRNGHLSIWDIDQQRRVARIRAHATAIQKAVFSADGRRIVTSDTDGEIKVWDIHALHADGVLGESTTELFDAKFSPTGETVALAGLDGTLRLYDTRTEVLLHEFPSLEPGQPCFCAAFSSDGRWLAIGRWESEVALIDTETAEEVWRHALPPSRVPSSWDDQFAKSPKGQLASMAFSPDGRWLATGFGSPTYSERDHDQIIGIWDVASGRLVRVLEGHRNYVIAVEFLPDGSSLVSAAKDGTIRFWSVGSWREERVLRDPSRSAYWSLTLAPDGTHLAAGDEHGAIVIWDITTNQYRKLTGHGNFVSGVSFAPSGRTLASASWDGTVKLWDILAGRETLTLSGHTHWVLSVEFDSTGDWLVSASMDRTARILHAKSLTAIDRSREEVDPALRARRLVARGRWEDAITFLMQAVETYPDQPLPWGQLAECRLQLGQIDGAAEAYAEALERMPISAHRSYETEHDSPQMRLCLELPLRPGLFERALELRPDDPRLLIALGLTLAREEEWESALRAFQRASFLGASSAYAPAHACLLLLTEDESGYRELVARMIDEAGDTEDFLHLSNLSRTASLALAATRNSAPLVRWGERAVRIQPNAWTKHAMGLAFHRAGRHQEAVAAFLESEDSGAWRGNVTNWLGLTLAYHALGNETEARRWWARATEYLEQTAIERYDEPGRLPVFYWLEALILHREAEKLLGQAARLASGDREDRDPGNHDVAKTPADDSGDSEPEQADLGERFEIDPTLLDDYVGQYRHAPNFIVAIVRREDELILIAPPPRDRDFPLVPRDATTFTMDVEPVKTVEFVQPAEGAPHEMIVTLDNGARVRAPRVSQDSPESPESPETSSPLSPRSDPVEQENL